MTATQHSPPTLMGRALERARALVDLAPDALERFVPPGGELRQRCALEDGGESYETSTPAYSHPARYALITVLGLRRLLAALPEGRPSDHARDLEARFEAHAHGPVHGEPERALAAWLDATLGRRAAVPARPVARLEDLGTQGVAWWLCAHVANGDEVAAEAAARELRLRQRPGGLFRASREPGLATFNQQSYPVHALAMHRDPSSLDAAARGMARLVELQGRRGQWWWLYDPDRGSVSDRYPVYAVHQAGMAPMALLEVASAGGPWHAQAMERSLEWLFGDNELGTTMVLEERRAIYRGIRRSERWGRVPAGLGRRGLGRLNGLLPGKEINRTTRSYTYGWLLFALAPLVSWSEAALNQGSRR
jgi:hypothetical protein